MTHLHQLLEQFHIWFRKSTLRVWVALFFFVLAMIPTFNLTTKVQISSMLEGNAAELIEYQKHLKDFPRTKSLIALITPLRNESWHSGEMQMALQAWLNNKITSHKDVLGCLSPFSLREVYYSEPEALLTFPLIVDTKSPHTSWQNLENSRWASFFLGKDLKTVLVFCRVSESTPVKEIDFLSRIKIDDSRFKVDWTGDALFDVFAEKGLFKTNLLNMTALVLLAFLVYVLFGSFVAVAIMMISMILGIGAVLGLMGLSGHSLDLLTSNLCVLLIIATVEDLFIVFYFSAYKKMSLNSALRAALIPSFYTSITTIIGFSSLMISDIPSVSRFAIWSTVGVIFEWFLVFFIVPFLIGTWKDLILKPTALFGRISQTVFSLVLPRKLAFILLLPLLAAPFLPAYLGYNADPYEMFPEDHPIKKVMQELKSTRGWENRIEIVFPRTNELTEIKELIQKTNSVKNITWVEHPLLLLEPQISAFKKHKTGEGGLALSTEELQELTQSQFYQTEMGSIYQSANRQRAFVYLEKTDMDSIRQTARQIDILCQNRCKATGDLVALGEYSRLLIKTLSGSLLLDLFFVFGLIYLLMIHLNVRDKMQVLVSILWGPTILLWLFILTGVSVSLISCVLLSTIAGLSGDNAIQYMFNARQNNLSTSVEEIGPSSGLLAIVMILLSFPWIFSDFVNVQSTGILLIACLILMLFGDFVLLRSLIGKRRSLFRDIP